ncbi:STAS/SEC14 domain-containing protein [Altibacter sp. HG106]|uniref:STAS/SEC14 domain-containing protein n=1 Tax=Altibacter sp. HG106 TaxID=3023937 RepID=UPI002350F9BD|nr:STAS/SEC14 domain-containing protein [Altibacter sp. HG106]MDC7994322.1 STAS/SEC14 domain-containing protein [Altibacter sp. HG106]
MISSFSFSDNTVGFLIEGKFTSEQGDKLQRLIVNKLETFPKINLYLEDAYIDGFSLQAVFDNVLFKFNHAKSFHKIALVTNRNWIHLCGKIDDFIMEGEVRSFPTEQRLKAMSWIAEAPID